MYLNKYISLYSSDFPELPKIIWLKEKVLFSELSFFYWLWKNRIPSLEQEISEFFEPFKSLNNYGLSERFTSNPTFDILLEDILKMKSEFFDQKLKEHSNPKLFFFYTFIDPKYYSTNYGGDGDLLYINSESSKVVDKYIEIRNQLLDLTEEDLNEFYELVKTKLKISWSETSIRKSIDPSECRGCKNIAFYEYKKGNTVTQVNELFSSLSRDEAYNKKFKKLTLLKKIENFKENIPSYIEEIFRVYLDNYDEIVSHSLSTLIKNTNSSLDTTSTITEIFWKVFFSSYSLSDRFSLDKKYYTLALGDSLENRPVFGLNCHNGVFSNNFSESVKSINDVQTALNEIGFYNYFDSNSLEKIQELKEKFKNFLEFDKEDLWYVLDKNYISINYKSGDIDYIDFSLFVIQYKQYKKDFFKNWYMWYALSQMIKNNKDLVEVIKFIVWSNNINNFDFLKDLSLEERHLWLTVWIFSYFN